MLCEQSLNRTLIVGIPRMNSMSVVESVHQRDNLIKRAKGNWARGKRRGFSPRASHAPQESDQSFYWFFLQVFMVVFPFFVRSDVSLTPNLR